MAEVPSEEEEESSVTTITDGYFEEEYYISAEDASVFMHNLADQLEDREVTLVGDDWELPLSFGEPVELRIEFDGDGEPELEIEFELAGRVENEMPDIA